MPNIPAVPNPEVQGIILRGYEFLGEARFLLLQFPTADGGRRWLQEIVPHIRDATERPQKDKTATNLAFTFAGLKALGLTEWVDPAAPSGSSRFSREFLEGMDTPHRQRVLGDTGASAPDHWDWGRQDTRSPEDKSKYNPYDAPVASDGADPQPKLIHALLMLYAGDERALETLYEAHRDQLAKCGIAVVRRLDTADLPNRKEHFGFRDGIAQPLVLGVTKLPPVGSVVSPDPGNQINPGEILLGFPNAYDLKPVSPAVSSNGGLVDFGYCGSYLVFRQLRQDVLAFWEFMHEATGGGEPEKLAAKMVGRWPSGAPLALSPDRDDPSLADSDQYGFYENDATNQNDRLGRRVPIGSHTRRSNPRDSLEPGPGGEGRFSRDESLDITRLHRMIRRGRPYGPAIAKSMKGEDILEVATLIARYSEEKIAEASAEVREAFKKEVQAVFGWQAVVESMTLEGIIQLLVARESEGYTLSSRYGEQKIAVESPEVRASFEKKVRAAFRGQSVVESMRLEDIMEALGRRVKQERGLHFLCFNASIARQFEFVQQTWINNPKFGGLYGDNDPIMGQRDTKKVKSADTFNQQGSPVRQRFQSLPEFVTVRGGAYFFMPGIEALKHLAGLPNTLPAVLPEKDLV